jgi:1,4-dihydroxy-2-naphthoate octaprenyltransferase
VPHTRGLLLATIAVVLLQHAINLFNDAADWRLGADVEKYSSWVRWHDGRPELADRHAVVSLLVGGMLGLLVLWRLDMWWLLLIAAPLLLLGYLYNAGKRPLSYTHFGEWVTGVCYGPGVFGCLWLVAGGDFDPTWLVGSLAFGALAMGLLLSHQPPQIETDRAAGKNAFAVRYGAERTWQVAQALFVMFALLLVGGMLFAAAAWTSGLLAALVAFLLWRHRGKRPTPKGLLIAASQLVVAGLCLNLAAAWLH